jgi:hypothetical protein
MAVKNKFTCKQNVDDFLEVTPNIDGTITVEGVYAEQGVTWTFDMHTSVKFCKTLSNEIRIIKMQNNG